ncbi:unnamed protein product, partial [Allacma fusca]
GFGVGQDHVFKQQAKLEGKFLLSL